MQVLHSVKCIGIYIKLIVNIIIEVNIARITRIIIL